MLGEIGGGRKGGKANMRQIDSIEVLDIAIGFKSLPQS